MKKQQAKAYRNDGEYFQWCDTSLKEATHEIKIFKLAGRKAFYRKLPDGNYRVFVNNPIKSK